MGYNLKEFLDNTKLGEVADSSEDHAAIQTDLKREVVG